MSTPSVFITGAATGIGAGLVSKLANSGWQVFAGYRSSPPESANWYKHPAVRPIQCDIASTELVHKAANLIAQATGNRLDLLINNAGCFTSGGVVEAADLNAYLQAMDINLYGPLRVIRACMPLLRHGHYPAGGKGRVINVASSSTLMTFPMAAAYTVSKQAFKTASAHLRLEMAPFEVQVTTLDPGSIATPMTDNEHKGAEQWQAIPESLRSQYRHKFIDADELMKRNTRVSAYTPEYFAEIVYRKIITKKRFRPLYLIGPGTAAMPLLQRLISLQGQENIWARLFRREHDIFSPSTGDQSILER